MKKFVCQVFVFSVAVLFLLGLAECYVESRPNPSKDKHSWMLRHSDELETLVLGNSHTFYGVSPSLLGNHAYSLAQVSQTYRYDLYLLKHYPMRRLKNIVLSFSYMSLWEDFESQNARWGEAIRYRLYMDCDIHSCWGRYGLECFSFPSFKEKLKSLYKPSHLSWDSLGWGTNYTLESRKSDWDNGYERTAENTYTDTSLVRLNCHFLEEIFSCCRQRNVRVVLVTTPVSSTYQRYKNKFQENVNKRCLDEMLGKFPEVVYLDLEKDSRFNPADFYDSDHLNRDGAVKLSSILSEYLHDQP